MEVPKTVSLNTWAATKPPEMELKQEDIDEIHALMTVVGEKLEALGTTFNFSFVTKMTALGVCQMQSRMGATLETMTPEFWASMLLISGGLDNLLENMEALLEASNERFDNMKKLSLILPSTSIIV